MREGGFLAKSPLLFVKMNNDGSCVNGMCGGGGVVRDNHGKVLMAYSMPLGHGTSNWAEAVAFLFGLKWCIEQGHVLIIGKTDSLLLHRCIMGEWRIEGNVKEIRKLMEGRSIFTKHCFREANQATDKMASLCHQQEVTHIYTCF